MLSSIASAALLGVAAVSAAPFSFPLPNGFPDVAIPSPALLGIEEAAQGTLPNAPLLTTLAPEDILNWQVLAFGETFEVAFYTSLLRNISGDVPGFTFPTAAEKEYNLEVFRAIRAQEELHALGANAIVVTAGGVAIEPCEYVFPTTSFETAVDFARTFTDVVLGALQAVQFAHATYGDIPYVPLIGSIIGQEGEQVGYFRQQLDLVPSELPFLTISTGQWVYSALMQLVIVPGSCPNTDIITKQIPILPPLTVLTTPIAPKTQYIQYEFIATGGYEAGFSLVYVNQQNLPIVEKPRKVSVKGKVVNFEALLPYDEYLMNGLTQALVTSSAGPFASAAEVAEVTLYGPGIIEIN